MRKIIRATTIPLSLNIFCQGVLKELSAKYDVVALSSPGNDLDEVASREEVRTIAVPMERSISIIKDCKALFILISVFLHEKPIMVHSMTPKAGLLCMVASKIARIPVRVHTFTGLVFPTSKGIKRTVLKIADWMTCACATHIVPEGEGVKNDLLNYGITKKPLRVLGYGNVRGVDMEYYSLREDVIRKVVDLALRDSNITTFLFVGRIVGDKGINELCLAFENLHTLYPNTRLWLVGPYEDSLDPISEDSRRLITENKAILPVGVKRGTELLAYYAAADCFILPSYREGFPNTVLEAGAMGLPSIVTDINGSREIIKQDENGIIVPPKDTRALFDAMKRIVDDTSGRKRMVRNARRMISDRYEQSFVRKCLYDYYDEILKPYV